MKHLVYYVQSISNIVKSININNCRDKSRRIIYIIENTGIIENFEMINVEDLEEIVMRLPKKKGTEEGITIAIY